MNRILFSEVTLATLHVDQVFPVCWLLSFDSGYYAVIFFDLRFHSFANIFSLIIGCMNSQYFLYYFRTCHLTINGIS